MSSGKWPHTVWKYSVGGFNVANPLIPHAGSGVVLLGSTVASSASSLTVVRVRYDLVVTGTNVLDSAGKAPLVPYWWQDLKPCYRIYNQVAALGPYQDPFGAGFGETDGLADGGFWPNPVPAAADNTTGHACQSVAFIASGNSEGMRTLPPATDSQVVAMFGFSYGSFAAGYVGANPDVTWQSNVYMKVLYGSATSIT